MDLDVIYRPYCDGNRSNHADYIGGTFVAFTLRFLCFSKKQQEDWTVEGKVSIIKEY